MKGGILHWFCDVLCTIVVGSFWYFVDAISSQWWYSNCWPYVLRPFDQFSFFLFNACVVLLATYRQLHGGCLLERTSSILVPSNLSWVTQWWHGVTPCWWHPHTNQQNLTRSNKLAPIFLGRTVLDRGSTIVVPLLRAFPTIVRSERPPSMQPPLQGWIPSSCHRWLVQDGVWELPCKHMGHMMDTWLKMRGRIGNDGFKHDSNGRKKSFEPRKCDSNRLQLSGFFSCCDR